MSLRTQSVLKALICGNFRYFQATIECQNANDKIINGSIWYCTALGVNIKYSALFCISLKEEKKLTSIHFRYHKSTKPTHLNLVLCSVSSLHGSNPGIVKVKHWLGKLQTSRPL